MTSEKRGRGRPRREGADEDILRVAHELLGEVGYAAFNVDTIVERSGIAKTTIYRRWPTKGTLVAAAIDRPSSATDADGILAETASLLAMLSGADDALDVIRALLGPRRERLHELMEPDRADMLLGALLVKHLLTQ